jgi:hypothetical protein
MPSSITIPGTLATDAQQPDSENSKGSFEQKGEHSEDTEFGRL